jgi:tetratricopeptide (TPR) repeat protein
MFERGLALDPGSVEARASLAGSLAGVMEGMTDTRAADLERAEALARQVLALSPRSPLGHWARGQMLRAQDHYKGAIPEYEAVFAFNRNSVGAISALADCKLHAGPIEEVVPLQEQALRLSPRDPLISNMYGRIGMAEQKVHGGVVVSAVGENVGDLVMSGKEALNLPRRLEPLHDPLSSSGRLMGVFGPVIEALVLPMLAAARRGGRRRSPP